MERLIPVVNRLQEVFQQVGVSYPIDLPQITVVGAQSSGKSSVLEAICGFDFLPRGKGIVTRRPTIVQLHKLKPEAKDAHGKTRKREMWVEFLHVAGKKFMDMSRVRNEIQEETDRSAGKNKKIKPQPIILKVYSEDVVDLTVVDLPGITRVPVGDQPDDIEQLVRALIKSYVDRPNSIILAVHPANADLATSDAIQLARDADPDGLRTLGVITKIDLMDEGTNALDMLQGKIFPLRRGYVGVVNRSQADIDQNVSNEEGKKEEMAFFKGTPVYAPYADQMGSTYLANTLSTLLMEHIRDCLPEIRAKVGQQLHDAKAQLTALGPVLTGVEDASAELLHSLTRYAGEFRNAIDGRPQSRIATAELFGGARINYIFHDVFGKTLDSMDPFEDLSTEDIRTAIRNATGHRTPLFVPEAAFELLAKRQIARFEAPALACVDLVYDDLTRLAESIESAELSRYKMLRESVGGTTLNLLKARKVPTIEMVTNIIEMETSYINTRHPDFVGGTRALASIMRSASEANKPTASKQGIASQQPNGFPQFSSLRSSLGRKAGEESDSWLDNEFLGRQQNKQNTQYIPGQPSSNFSNPTNAPSRSMLGRSNLKTKNLHVRRTVSTGGFSVPPHLRVGSAEPVDETEKQELEMIRLLLSSYFSIVRIRLQDMIPKAVMTFLVNKTKDSLQSELVTELYKPENFKKLMTEADDTAQRRKDTLDLIEMLEKAVDVINEVRDIY